MKLQKKLTFQKNQRKERLKNKMNATSTFYSASSFLGLLFNWLCRGL